MHQADATTGSTLETLGRGAGDLVILHPPTYLAWKENRPDRTVEGREGYAAMIGDMVVNSAPLLSPDGYLVLVSRPVRTASRVYTAIGELEREIENAGLTLVGYHLAIDRAGTEDWHILAGRRDTDDSD